MRILTTRGGMYVVMCLLSGFVGALSVALLQNTTKETLQVRRLEITDIRSRVRAVLSVDDDGSVYLRMLSKDQKPIVTLGVNESLRGDQAYMPSGGLIISDVTGKPSIGLRTIKKGEGALTFASAQTSNQVTVGYSPYGDFEDGHDRGAWGIQITGPDRKKAGLNVFATDGQLQGFTLPLQAPASTSK